MQSNQHHPARPDRRPREAGGQPSRPSVQRRTARRRTAGDQDHSASYTESSFSIWDSSCDHAFKLASVQSALNPIEGTFHLHPRSSHLWRFELRFFFVSFMSLTLNVGNVIITALLSSAHSHIRRFFLVSGYTVLLLGKDTICTSGNFPFDSGHWRFCLAGRWMFLYSYEYH